MWLKQSPKKKFEPKCKWFKISYLEFFFFLIFFRFWAYNFFIFVHTFQWTFFIWSLKANILQYSFFQKTSPILRTSTHLILKIICSRNTTKNLSQFANFPANIFLFGLWKKQSFLDAQELHSWSTLEANVCRFLYIFVRKFLSQRRSKIVSGLERQNDFLKGDSLFVSRRIFTIFLFNWRFRKLNSF